MSGPRIAVMLVNGPREGRLSVHTLGTLLRAWPDCDIFIRDDATEASNFAELERFAARTPAVRDLSRNPFPRKLSGLGRTLMDLLDVVVARIASGASYAAVLKLDPDALIWSPRILSRMADRLATGAGIVGCYRRDPHGRPRTWLGTRLERNLRWDCRWLGLRRSDTCWPVIGRLRPRLGHTWQSRAVTLARCHGYEPGAHVQGGIYAFRPDLALALKHRGWIDSYPSQPQGLACEEDVIFSLMAVAEGFSLADLNQDGDSSMSWCQSLPGFPFTPATLDVEALGALHPLKGDEGLAFRQRIDAAGLGPSHPA